MRWFSSEQLLANYDGFILDAYGVFWSGAYVFESAKQFMQQVIQAGKPLVVLSNATQMADEESGKYGSFGLLHGVHYNALLTSGQITQYLAQEKRVPFEKHWKKYFPWWPMHPNFKASYQNIFECTPFSETDSLDKADFIYLNTPYFEGRDQEHPAVFEEELNQISQAHLPVICPNPDYFAQHGQPPVFMVRQGILAARLQKMGVDVRYIGKPEEAVFTYACEKLREFKKDLPRIVMIGDNPQTDIRGAKKANLDSALLVETGILSYLYPQYSLQELDHVLALDEKPTYFLKKL